MGFIVTTDSLVFVSIDDVEIHSSHWGAFGSFVVLMKNQKIIIYTAGNYKSCGLKVFGIKQY